MVATHPHSKATADILSKVMVVTHHKDMEDTHSKATAVIPSKVTDSRCTLSSRLRSPVLVPVVRLLLVLEVVYWVVCCLLMLSMMARKMHMPRDTTMVLVEETLEETSR